ncbi:hypothetical protein BA895_18850 [Humibacillus sp. DSM 29435]|uniref:hypothetical protein n=1 Tax=Humibacillus sp. DSM 29435 TaxID=1869167 RepID=UPI0008723E04|nr:hypothetical protein [Humibacillus sp. DSM 29435]OFE16388.1 hypothetical protein BA895_18850 [Humibacillus sp. DSM 29435]
MSVLWLVVGLEPVLEPGLGAPGRMRPGSGACKGVPPRRPCPAFVDDEDEFEAHRALLGYPPEVGSLAERTAREVLDAVGAGEQPFATVGFARLRQVASEP